MQKFRSFWPKKKKQKNNPRVKYTGQGAADNSAASPTGQAFPGGHRKASRRILAAIAALLLMLVVWGISALAGSLIKVRSVEVTGDFPYSDSDIISYTGIETGARVNRIDRCGLERELLRKYTYLSEVKIKAGLLGRVRISVKSDTAAYYTLVAGEYYALSPDFRLLEKGEVPDFESAGLIFISLPKIKTAILGEYVVYYDTKSEYVVELIQELEGSELFSGIRQIDAANRYAISLKCDRFLVKIGAYKDIELKLRIASQMANDDVLRGDVSAILDVSDPAKATIRFE